ncbi:hypothetical protein V6Z12_D13G131800 [Gossypium hirsutum]
MCQNHCLNVCLVFCRSLETCALRVPVHPSILHHHCLHFKVHFPFSASISISNSHSAYPITLLFPNPLVKSLNQNQGKNAPQFLRPSELKQPSFRPSFCAPYASLAPSQPRKVQSVCIIIML